MPSIINSSTSSGLITTGSTDGQLQLQTGGTTALTISSGQVITASGSIGIGGTTPSGGGVGIAFPATQSASSNANTLDDYEEGSWTLTITPGSGSFTVANNTGYYVKIGKVVYINMWWRRTGESGLGGGLTLGGFPFPFESNSTDTARQRLWVTGYAFSSLTNRSFMIVVPDGGGSATTGTLSTGGIDYSGGQSVNASNMTGVNTEVYINGFYMTNT